MTRYIIGEKVKAQILVDTVTDDPAAYVAEFEPIDIINGEQYAWNDRGERYIFLTGTDFDVKNERSTRMGIVDVGSWMPSGPILRHDGKDDVELLRSALTYYLKSNEIVRNNLNLSLDKLINIALEQ